MSCAYRACIQPALACGVCPAHLVWTLDAGRRAEKFTGRARLTTATAEMRAA